MATHLPPVPPEQRSPKGRGEPEAARGGEARPTKAPDNLAEQDRQGNIRENTHNQGYQQDR